MPAACRAAIVRRIASSVDAVVGRGMCRVTSSWAPSLSAPVASPVAGSRTITPSGGSAVSRSIPARRRAAVFAQPVWPSKQPMNAGRSGTTASSWPRVRHAAGERHVQPAPAEHPRRRRGRRRRARAIAAWTAATRGEPEQVDPVELVGALAHVDVGVVEAGRDQAAARLDDLGAEVRASRAGRRRGARSRRSVRLARRSRRGPRPVRRPMKRRPPTISRSAASLTKSPDDGRRPPVAPGPPRVRP